MTPVAKTEFVRLSAARQNQNLNTTPQPRNTLSSTRPITFKNVAATAGVNFTYINGGNAERETRKMYEFTGSGVAVLDHDAAGWPVLYFTQGCSWPTVSGKLDPMDRLFRNLGDRSRARH